jgi:hypothetical protein
MTVPLAPWVAAEYTASGQIESFDNAMLLQSLYSIGTASRGVSASGRQKRRDKFLIDTDRDHQKKNANII